MWVFKTFHNDFLDFPGISRFVNLGLLSLLLNLVKNFSIFFISFKESSLCSYESSFCLHFISFYLNVCYCLPHTTLTFAFTFFFFCFLFRPLRRIFSVFLVLVLVSRILAILFFLTYLGFAGLFWWVCRVCFLPLLCLAISPTKFILSYAFMLWTPVHNIPLGITCNDGLVVMSCFNLCLHRYGNISPPTLRDDSAGYSKLVWQLCLLSELEAQHSVIFWFLGLLTRDLTLFCLLPLQGDFHYLL